MSTVAAFCDAFEEKLEKEVVQRKEDGSLLAIEINARLF